MVTGQGRTYYSYFAEWPPNGLLNAVVQLPASVTETSAWKAVNRVNAVGQSPEKSGGHLYPHVPGSGRRKE